MTLLARLKPYNERKGHLTRTYMIDGSRFFVDRGWYEVPDALGEKLRDLHQDHHNEDSPFLFDVGTQAEAERLEQREVEAETKATARRPATASGGRRAVAQPSPWPSIPSSNSETQGDITTADIAAKPVRSTAVTPPVEESAHPDISTSNAGVGSVDNPAQKLLDPADEDTDLEVDDGRIREVGRVGFDEGKSPKERRRK
jgi:hypothetical protein